VSGLSSGYGEAIIVRDVNFEVRPGEIFALLGKNGMGKSTLLKGIMGFLPPMSGSVRFGDAPLPSGVPHLLAARGIAYAPQEKAVFQDLTVLDNLRVAVPDNARLQRGLQRIGSYFPFIPQRLKQKAGTLSGGEQKMLILGRALMAEPRLMLIDEITEGLQPSVIERIAGVLHAERRASNIAMLVVEQNVPFALKMADRFAILDRGELGAPGRTDAPGAQAMILDRLGV
jgi:branched-chain amino acid transport system ATP-binding protein